MDKKVDPSRLYFGDEITINHHHYQVKAVNGPDHNGTYDLYLKDDQGRDRIEIVAEAVTLHL